MRPPADASFARFQHTRDPAALAAVFDATAPGLLLVAMHLCSDAALAEDLVQTVFLQAIRDAAAYDPRQPVLPWLLGILEHRASDLRRRAHRHRERPAEGVLPAPAASAPDRAAASAEVLQQVAMALEGLPPAYREVLTLRLVHGLRAVDIARAQGASPETVRTRLKRGLALLRRALPKSLARPFVLALLASESLRAGSGLSSIKQAVLATVPAATASLLGKWFVAAVAVVTAGLAWAALPRTETSVPASVPADRYALLTAEAGAVDRSSDSTNGAAAASTASHRRESGPGDLAADATLIRGRFVAAEDGTPLAGASVHVRAWINITGEPPPPDWQQPADVVTSADGCFRMELVPQPALAIELDFACPDRVATGKGWDSLRNGINVDLGDVGMHLGTPFEIRVVEATGRPCPGVEVSANLAADFAAHGGMPCIGRTDRNGVVAHERARSGRWRYEVESHLAGDKTAAFELPLQAATFVHTIVLHRPPPELSISGTVADTGGAAVPDLDLQLRTSEHGCFTTRTGTDGTFLFSIRTPAEGNRRLRLQLPHDRWELELVDDGGELSWGRNDLRLAVRQRTRASLTLHVIDATTGAAVPHFGVTCRPDLANFGAGTTRRSAPEPHPAGIVRFEQLAPGPRRICVFPPEPLGEQLELLVELREGELRSERIELLPCGQLQVQVIDAMQQPVPGIELSLGRVLPERLYEEADLATYRFTRESGGFTGQCAGILQLDRATSDQRGMATLRAARGTPALVVIAGGDRCVARMVKDVTVLQAENRIRIAVETAAVLSGTVRPVELLQRFGPTDADLAQAAEQARVEWPDDPFAGGYGSVRLRRPATNHTVVQADLAADGSFRLGSVPAGRFEVWIHQNVNHSDTGLGPLAVVEVHGAETKSLDLDATAFLPARAMGRCFVDGAAWKGEVGFARIGSGEWAMAEWDADGNARSPWLLPGSWLPFASLPPQFSNHFVLGSAPIVIAPGTDVAFSAALARRRVRVQLLDADGQPAPGRRLALEPIDPCPLAWSWNQGERADAEGLVTFDPAPPGRCCLRAFTLAQDPNEAHLQPAALVLGEVGAEQTSLTVRLPR